MMSAIRPLLGNPALRHRFRGCCQSAQRLKRGLDRFAKTAACRCVNLFRRLNQDHAARQRQGQIAPQLFPNPARAHPERTMRRRLVKGADVAFRDEGMFL